jgi:hypothetical protein
LTGWYILLILWFLAVFLFKIPARISYLFILLIIVISIVAVSFQWDAPSEELGNLLYSFIIIAFIQEYRKIKKQKATTSL